MEPNGPPLATSILDVDDDCLYNIFDRLSVMDLCATAETCTRFRRIAREAFRRKYDSLRVNAGSSRHFMRHRELSPIAYKMLRMLKTFGSVMVDLKIIISRHRDHQNNVADILFANCTALESLSLQEYSVPDDPQRIAAMRSLFGKLKKLVLIQVNIGVRDESPDDGGRTITENGNVLNVFDECQSLCHLEVHQCEGFSNRLLFSSTFPSLEHFECIRTISSTIGNFVLQHRNNLR